MGNTLRSRRAVLAPHLATRAKLRRCPICQWVIEEDHAEALAMAAAAAEPAGPPSASIAKPPAHARENARRVEPSGFAIVEPRAKATAPVVEEPEGVLESLLA